MYDDNDLRVMERFCERGVWLLAQKNKSVLHKWKHRGLTMPQVRDYIGENSEIGFILDTAGVVLVDLDNPLELTDEELAESGKALDDFKHGKKEEWKSYPEEAVLEILEGFLRIGEQSPPHVYEVSMSGYGIHWYYRCDDADGIHFSSPNIEIFGNKKPSFVQDWGLVEWLLDAEPVPLQAITDFWLPVEKQLNRITPPPKPEKRIYYSYSGDKVEFDYETYLANSQKAQSGRNWKLWMWVAKAAQHQDEDAIAEAQADARQNGLADSEIAKTVASARAAGAANPAQPYIRRKSNLAKAEEMLMKRKRRTA